MEIGAAASATGIWISPANADVVDPMTTNASAQNPHALRNATANGRALNRRVEVEFWYDDPLQELPDEPQLCPETAGAEIA